MPYDLVVAGGRVIDTTQGIDQEMDVAVSGGRIAALAQPTTVLPAKRAINAAGKLVVPGLIDMHCHAYKGVTNLGLDPDVIGVRNGVTTINDTGSSGAITFPGFRHFWIDRAATSVYCFLNLSSMGIITSLVGELKDLRLIDAEAIKATVDANRDVIRGIKMRSNYSAVGPNGAEALRRALEIAGELGLPVLVHIGETRPELAEGGAVQIESVLPVLRKGDILAHVYTAKFGGVVSDDGTVSPLLKEAVERGVLLDVGHGINNLSFKVVRMLRQEGIIADTISSDVTANNRKGPVYDLLTTMSKFLALGFSLPEVIERTTLRPARALGLDGEIGSLKPSYRADISILRVVDGQWKAADSEGEVLQAGLGLEPVLTVKAGTVYEPLLISRPYTQV